MGHQTGMSTISKSRRSALKIYERVPDSMPYIHIIYHLLLLYSLLVGRQLLLHANYIKASVYGICLSFVP